MKKIQNVTTATVAETYPPMTSICLEEPRGKNTESVSSGPDSKNTTKSEWILENKAENRYGGFTPLISTNNSAIISSLLKQDLKPGLGHYYCPTTNTQIFVGPNDNAIDGYLQQVSIVRNIWNSLPAVIRCGIDFLQIKQTERYRGIWNSKKRMLNLEIGPYSTVSDTKELFTHEIGHVLWDWIAQHYPQKIEQYIKDILEIRAAPTLYLEGHLDHMENYEGDSIKFTNNLPNKEAVKFDKDREQQLRCWVQYRFVEEVHSETHAIVEGVYRDSELNSDKEIMGKFIEAYNKLWSGDPLQRYVDRGITRDLERSTTDWA